MSEEMKGLLASVADEFETSMDSYYEVLERRLLPLLEVGQRERDRRIGCYEEQFDVEWDAAKAAAKGEGK